MFPKFYRYTELNNSTIIVTGNHVAIAHVSFRFAVVPE
jgi:hypothetical protein